MVRMAMQRDNAPTEDKWKGDAPAHTLPGQPGTLACSEQVC
jgi:hypothetical protein